MITGGGNGVVWSGVEFHLCNLLFVTLDFIVPSGTMKYTDFADLKVDL
jgi:hypothetical protein